MIQNTKHVNFSKIPQDNKYSEYNKMTISNGLKILLLDLDDLFGELII